MLKLYVLVALSLLLALPSTAQTIIPIENHSFEQGEARPGVRNGEIPGWIDCGPSSETSPDVHSELSDFHDVKHSAAHGFNFLMLVVRDDNTQEIISSQLETPLRKDSAYLLSIQLSRPPTCVSRSQQYLVDMEYNRGVIVRILGGWRYCRPWQLLAESPVIEDTDWNEHQFLLLPQRDLDYLFVEAYYNDKAPEPYNGSVLLDQFQLQSTSNHALPMHKMIASGNQYQWPSALKMEEMIAEVVPEGLERYLGTSEQSIHFTKKYPTLTYLYILLELEHFITLKGNLLDFLYQTPASKIQTNVDALRHIKAYASADVMEQLHHYYQLQQSSSISKSEAAYHTDKLQREFDALFAEDEVVEKRIRYLLKHRSVVIHQIRMAMVDLMGEIELLNLVKKQ